MRTPAEALALLQAAAADGRLDDLCARCGVRLMTAFGSAVEDRRGHGDPRRPPGDLDIAVYFGRPVEARAVYELADGLVQLTGFERIDLAVLDRASIVLAARALSGIGLYEQEPGQLAIRQMAALAQERDTRWLRELDLDALAR